MAVGPEFGPLAALAVALVRRQWKLGRRAALALGVGFPVAMLAAAFTAWLSVPLGLFPADVLDRGSAADFIYHPGPYSLIVAVLAGIAGMLSVISRALRRPDRRLHLRDHGPRGRIRGRRAGAGRV